MNEAGQSSEIEFCTHGAHQLQPIALTVFALVSIPAVMENPGSSYSSIQLGRRTANIQKQHLSVEEIPQVKLDVGFLLAIYGYDSLCSAPGRSG